MAGIVKPMLEKPELEDERIIACLETEYGLTVAEIAFLPLGADLNTAVYRVVADDETVYFLKLRRGEFSEAAVAVPKYLGDLGIKQIIPSLATQTGQLWAGLAPFKMILYPYVEGHHGFERSLSEQQWVEFGAALKKFHTADIPSAITSGIQREEFSPKWRDTVKVFLERTKEEAFDEPIAVEMAAFLRIKGAETLELLTQAEQLAQILQKQPPEFILCHADIHAWNLLIADNGSFYMVDWDTLIFAPKERDLMFVGGGLGGNRYTPQEEEALFYQGYGQVPINPIALAYYRYERIIEDIAVYCEQIFLSNEGGADRKQSLEYLKSSFLPDSLIEMARQSDKTLRAVYPV
ncbi:MAG: aminoglycoside phosphotransferase family protein [Chloroflexi bacterium]|nr:aminoglycoside phosphotransferase family protein [Chloroflexota bacterium]